MTLRGFILGLIGVVLIAAVTPYNDFVARNTYVTGNFFPAGAFFILLILTFCLNLIVKLIWRAWALRQSELMLAWCMMIVACTVPASGLMRYWFSMLAAPAYYAPRPDIHYEKHVLPELPEELVLTKDMRSVATKRFFEGPASGEEPRVPWGMWMRPLATWGVFILFFYLATFFLTGLLRKQWVESERLIFPLARVPLELTEGSGERALLPSLVRQRAFLIGALATFIFGLMRAFPVLMGGASGWQPIFNIQAVLWETPIAELRIGSAYFFPIAVGFAFLVPADVALSIWFFFLFTRVELLTAYWMGTPLEGYTYGPFMAWQQAGAFIAFTIMMFWMARRHLWAVLRKAFGGGRDVDDSEEPVSYGVGFWGLVAAGLAMLAWFVYYTCPALREGGAIGTALKQVGSAVPVGLLVFALVMCIALVHARLVAQGGIFFSQQTWTPTQLLHGLSGGRLFSAPAALVAQMQHAILSSDAREILSGHAVNAYRISGVFRRHRRWFLPVMMVALAVAVVVCAHATLSAYYREGGVNTGNTYGIRSLPLATFDTAHQMIDNPAKSAEPHVGALAAGAGIMFFVTIMRMRFYWWPMHSLGFLIGSTWSSQNLWFPFLLGWFIKLMILKFGSGAALRTGRRFFMGVIVAESALVGIATVLGLLGIKIGNLFLPV